MRMDNEEICADFDAAEQSTMKETGEESW